MYPTMCTMISSMRLSIRKETLMKMSQCLKRSHILLLVDQEIITHTMKSMKLLKWGKWPPFFSIDGAEHYSIFVSLYTCMGIWQFTLPL